MTQTKPGGFLSLLVPHQTPNFEPPMASAPVAESEKIPDEAERNRQPERDESFYWGFHTSKYW